MFVNSLPKPQSAASFKEAMAELILDAAAAVGVILTGLTRLYLAFR